MSRIAKKPIELPAAVTLTLENGNISVKGPKGTLQDLLPPLVDLKREDDKVITFNPQDNSKKANALAGTARSLVSNMVHGVEKGFEKKLKLIGVGYRAQLQGKKLNLTLGFSHPVVHDLPDEVSAELPSQTEIVLKSANKQLLGLVASDIRSYRPPEIYKGKGVRYDDERISLKEAKKK